MIKKLLNLKLKFTKNQKGLTLIELLVVIVILGIIAAIAIPAISGQNEKARENAAAQTNAVVKDAANRYIAVEDTSSDTDPGKVTLKELNAKNYFQDPPECPEGYTAATAATDDLLTVKFCK